MKIVKKSKEKINLEMDIEEFFILSEILLEVIEENIESANRKTLLLLLGFLAPVIKDALPVTQLNYERIKKLLIEGQIEDEKEDEEKEEIKDDELSENDIFEEDKNE